METYFQGESIGGARRTGSRRGMHQRDINTFSWSVICEIWGRGEAGIRRWGGADGIELRNSDFWSWKKTRHRVSFVVEAVRIQLSYRNRAYQNTESPRSRDPAKDTVEMLP